MKTRQDPEDDEDTDDLYEAHTEDPELFDPVKCAVEAITGVPRQQYLANNYGGTR